MGKKWYVTYSTNLVAAYQPKGAASQAASYVNLVTPGTYDLTTADAPGWAAGTGWVFNDTTQNLVIGGGTFMVLKPATIILRCTRSIASSGDCVIVGASSSLAFYSSTKIKMDGVGWGAIR